MHLFPYICIHTYNYMHGQYYFFSNEDFLCDSLDGSNNNLKKRKLSENHKNVVNNNLLNGMMNVKQETGKFYEISDIVASDIQNSFYKLWELYHFITSIMK